MITSPPQVPVTASFCTVPSCVSTTSTARSSASARRCRGSCRSSCNGWWWKKKVAQPVGWGKEIYKKKVEIKMCVCVCVCLKTIFSLLFCPRTFVRTTCQGVHGRVRLGLPMGREVTHQWLARWCGADGRGLMSPFGAWSQTVRQGDRLHFAHWCFCVCGGVGVWSVWSWNCNENVTF